MTRWQCRSCFRNSGRLNVKGSVTENLDLDTLDFPSFGPFLEFRTEGFVALPPLSARDLREFLPTRGELPSGRS